MFSKIIAEDYKDEYFAEDWETDKDYFYLVDEEVVCADKIFDLLEELLVDALTEEFTSVNNKAEHFRRHCLGKNNTWKKSSRGGVYYDFTDIKEYEDREAFLDKEIRSSSFNIKDLCDVDTVTKAMHKLFAGNICINFNTSCGLYNNSGRVALSIHSFATDATTNYPHNTVDFVVRTPAGNTITLYPVDANYLENKLNNIFQKCGFPCIHYNR